MPEVKKNTHGGRRAGAGDKPRAVKEAAKNAGSEALRRFTDRALKDLDALYQAQKDLATGLYYEGCGRCRKPEMECTCVEPYPVRVYQKPPNQKAGADLLAHAKGRAAVAQQVQAETTILLSLGCAKCGTAIPRPPRSDRKKGEDVLPPGDL